MRHTHDAGASPLLHALEVQHVVAVAARPHVVGLAHAVAAHQALQLPAVQLFRQPLPLAHSCNKQPLLSSTIRWVKSTNCIYKRGKCSGEQKTNIFGLKKGEN